ncbi:hypothetical protein SNEBB_002140 [Seison nebaliae]|nr:hypothetical protein SNEBB_002140 [Seison nebaliae]
MTPEKLSKPAFPLMTSLSQRKFQREYYLIKNGFNETINNSLTINSDINFKSFPVNLMNDGKYPSFQSSISNIQVRLLNKKVTKWTKFLHIVFFTTINSNIQIQLKYEESRNLLKCQNWQMISDELDDKRLLSNIYYCHLRIPLRLIRKKYEKLNIHYRFRRMHESTKWKKFRSIEIDEEKLMKINRRIIAKQHIKQSSQSSSKLLFNCLLTTQMLKTNDVVRLIIRIKKFQLTSFNLIQFKFNSSLDNMNFVQMEINCLFQIVKDNDKNSRIITIYENDTNFQLSSQCSSDIDFAFIFQFQSNNQTDYRKTRFLKFQVSFGRRDWSEKKQYSTTIKIPFQLINTKHRTFIEYLPFPLINLAVINGIIDEYPIHLFSLTNDDQFKYLSFQERRKEKIFCSISNENRVHVRSDCSRFYFNGNENLQTYFTNKFLKKLQPNKQIFKTPKFIIQKENVDSSKILLKIFEPRIPFLLMIDDPTLNLVRWNQFCRSSHSSYQSSSFRIFAQFISINQQNFEENLTNRNEFFDVTEHGKDSLTVSDGEIIRINNKLNTVEGLRNGKSSFILKSFNNEHTMGSIVVDVSDRPVTVIDVRQKWFSSINYKLLKSEEISFFIKNFQMEFSYNRKLTIHQKLNQFVFVKTSDNSVSNLQQWNNFRNELKIIPIKKPTSSYLFETNGMASFQLNISNIFYVQLRIYRNCRNMKQMIFGQNLTIFLEDDKIVEGNKLSLNLVNSNSSLRRIDDKNFNYTTPYRWYDQIPLSISTRLPLIVNSRSGMESNPIKFHKYYNTLKRHKIEKRRNFHENQMMADAEKVNGFHFEPNNKFNNELISHTEIDNKFDKNNNDKNSHLTSMIDPSRKTVKKKYRHLKEQVYFAILFVISILMMMALSAFFATCFITMQNGKLKEFRRNKSSNFIFQRLQPKRNNSKKMFVEVNPNSNVEVDQMMEKDDGNNENDILDKHLPNEQQQLVVVKYFDETTKQQLELPIINESIDTGNRNKNKKNEEIGTNSDKKKKKKNEEDTDWIWFDAETLKNSTQLQTSSIMPTNLSSSIATTSTLNWKKDNLMKNRRNRTFHSNYFQRLSSIPLNSHLNSLTSYLTLSNMWRKNRSKKSSKFSLSSSFSKESTYCIPNYTIGQVAANEARRSTNSFHSDMLSKSTIDQTFYQTPISLLDDVPTTIFNSTHNPYNLNKFQQHWNEDDNDRIDSLNDENTFNNSLIYNDELLLNLLNTLQSSKEEIDRCPCHSHCYGQITPTSLSSSTLNLSDATDSHNYFLTPTNDQFQYSSQIPPSFLPLSSSPIPSVSLLEPNRNGRVSMMERSHNSVSTKPSPFVSSSQFHYDIPNHYDQSKHSYSN